MNRHFFVHVAEFFVVTLAMICCLIVTSDGPWFPWANFIALMSLYVFVAVLSRRKRLGKNGRTYS